MIAYDEPQSSPQGYLLGDSYKMDLAAAVNAAILKQKGRWSESRLERLLKQLVRRQPDACQMLFCRSNCAVQCCTQMTQLACFAEGNSAAAPVHW